MAIWQDVKVVTEEITGMARPSAVHPRDRKPHTFRFADDGETPNNPYFPLVLYRSPVHLDPHYDPAAIFEALFAQNAWEDSWRNGIFDFLHFHTHTHEVLGIACGAVRVQFGGKSGNILELRAGDVAVLPAGTGHRRISCSKELLVVGAYPHGGRYDQPKPGEVDHKRAILSIAEVQTPTADPVYGRNGPLNRLWQRRPSATE